MSAKSPLWSIGFRPYFLIGSAVAPLLMIRWVLAYNGTWPLHASVPPVIWHAHEMLFGFALAFVFGFLLTASANWAHMPPVSGRKLAAASLCFLAARAFSLASGSVSLVLFSAFDLLATCLVLIFLYPYLSAARRNFGIFGILSLLFVLSLAFHLQQHEIMSVGFDPNRAALHLLLLVVAMISGRVIPFFTGKRLATAQPAEPKILTILAIFAIAAVGIMDVLDAPPLVVMSTGVLAFVAHSVRLWRWYLPKIWSEPMLWVLYVAYAWLSVGYLLFGLSGYAIVTEFTALHAWTAGAISTMILGIAARVSLGHSGRPIVASPLLIFAFVTLTVAAAMRVLGILVWPQLYVSWVFSSGVLWALSFVLLVGLNVRIWLTPRL